MELTSACESGQQPPARRDNRGGVPTRRPPAERQPCGFTVPLEDAGRGLASSEASSREEAAMAQLRRTGISTAWSWQARQRGPRPSARFPAKKTLDSLCVTEWGVKRKRGEGRERKGEGERGVESGRGKEKRAIEMGEGRERRKRKWGEKREKVGDGGEKKRGGREEEREGREV